MAHRVIGLDLGASEVKAVVVRMALRGSEIAQIDSEPVVLDEDGRSTPEDVQEAAGRLIERLNIDEKTIHCVVPGELASVRRIVLPSSASRRLEQVLKFELDEVLPFDIEDAVFDYVEVGHDKDEITVVTGAVLSTQVEKLIDGLKEHDIAPREIGIGTLAYAVKRQDWALDASDDIAAIVDIGHQRTSIAILEETTPTVRTVLRGSRDLTAKLSKVGGVNFEKAEAFKRQHGLEGKVGEVIEKALRPLIREIQQTFKGHLASGGTRVKRLLLCGGGGLLTGLKTHLENELGVPVERYGAPLENTKSMVDNIEPSMFVLSHSLAQREEIQRAKKIDLRRGSLAFTGHFEFVRRRLAWMTACVLGILLSWIFGTYTEYSALAQEADTNRTAVLEKTKTLFGKSITNHDEIKKTLEGEKAEVAPMPQRDAFDVVIELSKRIPFSITHDVDLLEIKPKRITLRGIVDAELKAEEQGKGNDGKDKQDAGTDLSPTDLIKQKLEGFKECFNSIRVGKVTLAGDRRRYQMDIESRCP